MSNSEQLVEHFFRHEYANLVAVLTRAFGVARIDLIEDMVGSAMLQAMHVWKQKGVPENPAGWIHRVARNRILDCLRRDKAHEKAMAFSGLQSSSSETEQLLDSWLDEKELPDGLLRMMFVCCHPSLDRSSQIALSLKILCGFSLSEIARGLLLSTEAVKKKVQRAKKKLAEEKIAVEIPPPDQLHERLSAVHEVLYLMFNEGYSTSHGSDPIRDDVCEEAARLCHLLCENEQLSNSESKALLALMLFHAARLEARVDSLGNPVLLGDQDRSKWDRKLIAVADQWLVRSVENQPSRFHFEAVIAQMHCAAESVEETDWRQIAVFYERLQERYPSPVYQLNHSIALAQDGRVDEALRQIEQIRDGGELKDYYLLDCTIGYIQTLAGNTSAAIDAYLDALQGPIAPHQKTLIEKRLREISPST